DRRAAAWGHDRLATCYPGPPLSRDLCPARRPDPARYRLGPGRPSPRRGDLQSARPRPAPGMRRRPVITGPEREYEVIALIDYGAGNLRSVQNALARLGASCAIVSTPEDLALARAIIFPGVGAAAPA